MPNTWDIKVPNGLYAVTVGHPRGGGHQHWLGYEGCTFENVRHNGHGRSDSMHDSFVSGGRGVEGVRKTVVLTVEVLDGSFTLGRAPKMGKCDGVDYIKLDLITSSAFPTAWLPAPKHEWWQMELDVEGLKVAPAVGLVAIGLPHHTSINFRAMSSVGGGVS